MINRVVLFFVVGFLVSCQRTDVVYIDLPDFEPRPVISCLFNTTTYPVLYAYHTTQATDNSTKYVPAYQYDSIDPSIKFIEGLQFEFFENGNFIDYFTEDGKGRYSINYIPKTNNIYTIKTEIEGEVITATDTVPGAISIDSTAVFPTIWVDKWGECFPISLYYSSGKKINTFIMSGKCKIAETDYPYEEYIDSVFKCVGVNFNIEYSYPLDSESKNVLNTFLTPMYRGSGSEFDIIEVSVCSFSDNAKMLSDFASLQYISRVIHMNNYGQIKEPIIGFQDNIENAYGFFIGYTSDTIRYEKK